VEDAAVILTGELDRIIKGALRGLQIVSIERFEAGVDDRVERNFLRQTLSEERIVKRPHERGASRRRLNTRGQASSTAARLESMLTRRRWIATSLNVGALLVVGRPALAAEGVEVVAPSVAVAAIVAATSGPGAAISIDPELEPAQVRISGALVDVRGNILLKGDPRAQRRFLDDPRNAAKLGASLRRALTAAYPARAADFEGNHRTWSRAFAHDVLQWNSRLERAAVRGQRVRDQHHRAYQLEWAGAIVDESASAPGPATLATLADDPRQAHLASYREYIEALVRALVP